MIPRRPILIIVLLLLTAAGCRQARKEVYLDTLHTERRMLEDRVWELQYQVEVAEDELAAARQANEKLRSRRGPTDGESPDEAAPGGFDLDDLRPPTIEMGLPNGHAPTPPPLADLRAGREAGDPPNARRFDVRAAEVVDTYVTHVAVVRQQTGGASFDGVPGDEGLRVTLQPRNAAGQYVPEPGHVSVVLLDPQRESGQAGIARWDLDSQQVNQFLQYPPSQPGIRLELPWHGEPPANPRLSLFVRYTTVDGRQLPDVQHEVLISPPSQFSGKWMPREGGSGDPGRPAGRARPQTAAAPADNSRPAAEQAERSLPDWRPYR